MARNCSKEQGKGGYGPVKGAPYSPGKGGYPPPYYGPGGKGGGKFGDVKGKGKGSPQCWNCGGYGHLSRNCQAAPKGKGKGLNEFNQEAIDIGGGKGDHETAGGRWNEQGEWEAMCLGECHILDYDRPKLDGGLLMHAGHEQGGQVWEKVTMLSDSGSADHVVTKGTATAYPLEQTPASIHKMKYTTASKHQVVNEGQRTINDAWSDTGDPLKLVWQVADISRNLGSVSRTVDASNRVVFDSEGSYILHKPTGRKLDMRRVGNTWEYDVWIRKGGRPGIPQTPAKPAAPKSLKSNGNSAFAEAANMLSENPEYASPFTRLEDHI